MNKKNKKTELISNYKGLKKTEAARQYIVEKTNDENNYYTIPTRTLAKILCRDIPEVFGEYNDKNIETTRSVVRKIRWSNGGQKKERAAIDKLFADRFRGFLQPDMNNITPFVIPENILNLLILADTHLPFYNKTNLESALMWGKEHGVDGVLLNGDILDCYKISRFLIDRRKRDMVTEFEMLREWIDNISYILGGVPIYYKMGNHEERIEKLVLREVPQLIEFLSFESCLKDGGKFNFNDYNLTLIGDQRIVNFTKHLNILHGHELRTGGYGVVSVARWLFTKTKTNSICNHFHRKDSYSETNLKDEIFETWCGGCLCDLKPQYMPYNNWRGGFMNVRRQGELFSVNNLAVDNGIIYDFNNNKKINFK